MTNKKLNDVGEFGLIGQIQKQVSKRKDVIQGIGDDTAVLPLDRSRYQLFTTDMVVEGVHFFPGADPVAVGYKAMACNISDIAAMGGLPTYAVVSLGVSGNKRTEFIKDIYRGMEMAGRKFKVAVVGGDTVKSRKLLINVALLGTVKRKELTLRSGAKAGDTVFVTGALGRSLQTGKHFCFAPRVKEAQYLVKYFKPSAMIDISDGLVADLGHILKESHVGAVIFEELIPRGERANVTNALYDGEDFELIFTLSRKEAEHLRKSRKDFKFYPIGKIVKRKGLELANLKGQVRTIPLKGYEHF